MELRRESDPAGLIISGFTANGFRVGEAVIEGGLLIDAAGAVAWHAPAVVADLTPDMLGTLLDGAPQPEFLLLGTGPGLVRPSRTFIEAIEARGIGVEVMDSRAAARAWGVLRREERQIVAALMPHSPV